MNKDKVRELFGFRKYVLEVGTCIFKIHIYMPFMYPIICTFCNWPAFCMSFERCMYILQTSMFL
jgi:hypothetical protein